MKNLLICCFAVAFFVSCNTKSSEISAPDTVADSIQIVLDTAAKDSVLPDTPKTLLYDTEIFIYDTAYFVDPMRADMGFSRLISHTLAAAPMVFSAASV